MDRKPGFGIGIVGCLRGVVGAGSLACVARSVVDYVIVGSLAKQLYQTELTTHEASVNHI